MALRKKMNNKSDSSREQEQYDFSTHSSQSSSTNIHRRLSKSTSNSEDKQALVDESALVSALLENNKIITNLLMRKKLVSDNPSIGGPGPRRARSPRKSSFRNRNEHIKPSGTELDPLPHNFSGTIPTATELPDTDSEKEDRYNPKKLKPNKKAHKRSEEDGSEPSSHLSSDSPPTQGSDSDLSSFNQPKGKTNLQVEEIKSEASSPANRSGSNNYTALCLDTTGRILQINDTTDEVRQNLITILQSKATNLQLKRKNKDKDYKQVRILRAIVDEAKIVTDIEDKKGLTTQKDKDHILLFNIKTKAYSEELYNQADSIVPFITGGILYSIYTLVSYLFSIPIWFKELAPSIGLAAGKNISLISNIQDFFRNKITWLFSKLGFGNALAPAVSKVTTPASELPTAVQQTAPNITSENSAEKNEDYNKYKTTLTQRTGKHFVALFDDEIPLVVTQDTVPHLLPGDEELNALNISITELIGAGDLRNQLKELHSKLNNSYTDDRNRENDKKKQYLISVAQQARHFVEAYALSKNSTEQLNHMLLLKAKAESDPEEWSTLAKYIVPILLIGLLVGACIAFSHYFVLHYAISAVNLMDIGLGLLLKNKLKEDTYNLASAPTASKIAYDYIMSLSFFNRPIINNVSAIGKLYKEKEGASDRLTDSEESNTCRALMNKLI